MSKSIYLSIYLSIHSTYVGGALIGRALVGGENVEGVRAKVDQVHSKEDQADERKRCSKQSNVPSIR